MISVEILKILLEIEKNFSKSRTIFSKSQKF